MPEQDSRDQSDASRVPVVGAAGTGSPQPTARENGREFPNGTLEFWQRKTARVLTVEDAREIAVNLTGFFNVLREWAAAEGASANAAATQPSRLGRGSQGKKDHP